MKKLTLLLFVIVLPFVIMGQFYSLQGVIKEKNTNKPLSDARITIGDLDLYVKIAEDGTFNVSRLKADNYKVKVSHIGFKTISYNINLNKDTKLDFKMEKEVIMTEEVIIKSSRVQQNTPATYTTISGNQLEQSNTGQDLPYLMKLTPSVIVTSDAGTGIGYTGIRIRGSDLTRINVTLNGVPVNDPESHNVFFVDLPDLASSINDIQIQRGVGTSTNGAAAFGASINIQTNQLNDKPYAQLSSHYGSYNTFKNSLLFGTGKLKNNWAFDGRFSAISSDGYIDRGSSDLKSAYFSGGYFGKKTIIKGMVTIGKQITYQAWDGIPKEMLGTNRTYNFGGEIFDGDSLVGYYKNHVDNYQQNYFQLHLAREINQNLHFTSSAFYTKGFGYYESYKNDRVFSDYGYSDIINGNDTITGSDFIQQKWLDNDFFGVNASLNFEKDKIDLNVGGGWNNYEGQHFGYVIWSQFNSNISSDQPWYNNEGTKIDYHFFGKVNYQALKKLNIYADLQYRNISYGIVGTHDDLRDLTQDHQFSFINPKTGIFYKINDYQDVYFSFGIAHREPNRTVYREADPDQIENIKVEKLFDYEIGYKLNHNSFDFESNLFFMDYKDQLVLTGEINNVGAAIMTNVPVSFRAGIEFISRYRFNEYFQWIITGTFSQNKIKNFKAFIDNWDYWYVEDEPLQYEENYKLTDISFSPNLTSSSNLIISPMEDINIIINSIFVGRQYIDNTQNIERSLEPYHVHDFKIIYSLKLKGIDKLNLSISLNNILNHQYESNAWVYRYYYEGHESMLSGYFPQAGFNIIGGVNIQF